MFNLFVRMFMMFYKGGNVSNENLLNPPFFCDIIFTGTKNYNTDPVMKQLDVQTKYMMQNQIRL